MSEYEQNAQKGRQALFVFQLYARTQRQTTMVETQRKQEGIKCEPELNKEKLPLKRHTIQRK